MSQNSELSFSTDDAFGWEGFADRLSAYLDVESEFVTGSLVVSLDAPFGSGKSTFLGMWKSRLDTNRKSNPAVPLCVTLNAWEDDYCGDPLLSLVHAIDDEVGRQIADSRSKEMLTNIKEAATDVWNFGLGLANSFASHTTGLDPLAAKDYTEKQQALRKGLDSKPDALLAYEGRRNALRRLKESLYDLMSRLMVPVLILVDELDRCRPDFAIQYLETIKHLFDIKGLRFILAVDAAQLENSAKALFGQRLKFDEYYRKFAHSRTTLPKPDIEGIRKLVTLYTNTFLDDPSESGAKRKTMLKLGDVRSGLVDLSLRLNLGPRQIQEAFRLLGHLAAAKSPVEPKQELFYFISASSVLLVFLRVGRPESFRKIAEGTMSVAEMLCVVVESFSQDRREWWAMLIVTMMVAQGELEERKPGPDLESILKDFVNFGLLRADTTSDQLQRAMGRHSMELHRGSHTLKRIARRIIELDRFGA